MNSRRLPDRNYLYTNKFSNSVQPIRTLLILLILFGPFVQTLAQDLELVIPRGHTNPVTQITASPDKKFIISSDGTNELIIWSVMSQNEVVRHELSSPVQIIVSADSATYVGLGDGTLYTIDYADLNLKSNWQATTAIQAIGFEEDIFIGQKSGLVHRMDALGNIVDSLQIGHEITALQAQNNNVWVGTGDGLILSINLQNMNKALETSVSKTRINHLKKHSNGHLYASDDRGYIHDLNPKGELVNSVQVFGLRAREFIIATDSTLLMVGRDDFSNIRQANITNWKITDVGLWPDEPEFSDFPLGLYAIKRFSPTKYLISGYERNFLLVDSLNNKVQFKGEASVLNNISLDASGTKLAIASNNNEIQIINLTGARDPQHFSTQNTPTSLQWANQQLYAGLANGTIAVVSHDSLSVINPGITAEYPTTKISINPSQNRFLRKYAPATLNIHDLGNGASLGTIKKALFAYQYLPNTNAIIYVNTKNKLQKVDALNLKNQLTFPVNEVSDFNVLEEGLTVVARSGKIFYYLDVQTGDVLKKVSLNESGDNFYLSPDGSHIFLTQASRAKGSTETNYRAAVYDDSGNFKFGLEGHTAQIRDIEFLKNGKFILSAAADGVIKIWDRDGKLLGNVIPLENGQHTVVSAKGQFDATLLAMDKLSYRQGKESIKLEQVKAKYYEPGILAKLLEFKNEPIAAAEPLVHVKLYPEFDLKHPMQNDGILGIDVKPREGGVGRIIILINGKEAPHNIDVSAEGHAEFDVMTHPYILAGDLNKISVKIYNEAEDAVSSPKNLFYLDKQKPEELKPHLYGLVVGVSDYHGEGLDLKYAAKDATDIAMAIESSAKVYLGEDNVHIKRLTTLNDSASNLWPRKVNIMAQFDSIAAKATPRDILFLYLSGHGEVDEDSTQEFYYLTADAGSGSFNDPVFRKKALISNNELIEKLQTAPTLKQVMIVDACHSGSLVSTFDGKSSTMSSSQVKSLETLKDRANIYVLAGSAEDAVSYESSIYGQGLLTYSLLMGMKGPALRNNQFVDILQLFNFASSEVPDLANDIGGIQKPEIRIPSGGSFDIGQFNEQTKKDINLNSPKPIFIHSIFQHQDEFVDVLDLGRIVDSELRFIDNTSDSQIVFLNTNEYYDAFVIQGRYTLIKEQGLSIQVKLFKDKSQITAFEVEAPNAGEAKKIIIQKVLKAIEPLL